MVRNIIYTGFLFIAFILNSCSSNAIQISNKSYFNNWPEGKSPREIGKLVAEHFVETPHSKINPGKTITYPEVCTWFGAIKFAEATNDSVFLKELTSRFEPLLGTEDTLIPKPNHVDNTVFGSVPLELYIQTNDIRFLKLGKMIADKQWEPPIGDYKTDESQKFYEEGLTWQTRLWIDDMFMITAVQTEAFKATKDEKYLNRAAKEMVVYLDSLQQPNGLFYHAPDVPFFWGRGDGWMASGMLLLLQVLHLNIPTIKEFYLVIRR